MNAYELALTAQDQNSRDTYNIYYNQTRLLLKIYTEYLANEGNINIIKYVNMDNMPPMNSLFVSISEIIQRFYFVVNEFPQQLSWDLYFHLLLSYSTYLETEDDISGEVLLELCNKFISYFHVLIRLENELLIDETTHPIDDDEYQRDSLQDQAVVDLQTGSGIKTKDSDENFDDDVTETESVSRKTILETLSLGYRFIYQVMNVLFESSISENTDAINFVQKNYMDDVLSKFLNQLSEIETASAFDNAEILELNVLKFSIQGMKILFQNNYQDFLSFLDSMEAANNEDVLMVEVDLLESSISIFLCNIWDLRTKLSKCLSKLQGMLAATQSAIVIGKLKKKENDLSPTVFKLCEIMISRADNELARLAIKKAEAPAPNTDAAKSINVLQKNALALLSNVKALAHRSCGFSEYINDKLKRNYIFSQAAFRLDYLNGETSSQLPDSLADHPYYLELHKGESQLHS